MGDYLKDTATLSMTEDGAYTLLLDHYYVIEGPLSKDVKSLYRVVRAFERWEREAVDSVLAKFFILTERGYENKRAEEELAKYKKAADKYRANGKTRNTDPQEVDHRIAIVNGGTNDESTLVTSCLECNSGKGPSNTGNLISNRPKILEARSQIKPKDKNIGAQTAPKRSTTFPDDFVLTEARSQYASVHGIADVATEFERFREHHVSKGNVFRNWDSAWRTWVLRADKFAVPVKAQIRSETQVGAGPQAIISEEARQKALERKRVAEGAPRFHEVDTRLRNQVQGVAAKRML